MAIIPPQAKRSKLSGNEVLDENIGLPDQPIQYLKPGGGLEVDGDGSLVPIYCQEVRRLWRQMGGFRGSIVK
jgi:hypothetical protein